MLIRLSCADTTTIKWLSSDNRREKRKNNNTWRDIYIYCIQIATIQELHNQYFCQRSAETYSQPWKRSNHQPAVVAINLAAVGYVLNWEAPIDQQWTVNVYFQSQCRVHTDFHSWSVLCFKCGDYSWFPGVIYTATSGVINWITGCNHTDIVSLCENCDSAQCISRDVYLLG